jgi:hypothetical protein
MSCAPLELNQHVVLGSFDTDEVGWQGARCSPRKASLVRVGGGYVRRFVYDVDGAPRTATGTGKGGHQGWGFTMNHYGKTSTSGQGAPGTFGPLFVGRHHAIYRYAFTVTIAGRKVPVVQHWFFATARDNPVLATTYDVSGSPPGSLVADSRTPYGDIAWDGDDQASRTVVDGVGWGDRYKFVTTTAPLTMESAWDYSKPNRVPYVLAWTVASDAEMGAVQTQTYDQHDAGGYWFYENWGRTSANAAPQKEGQIGRMTPPWNWTYQINQYELCAADPKCLDRPTGSHRLAWGANYGAIGGATAGSGDYAAYGDDKMISGYPYNSYSVFMVLGRHSEAPVARQVAAIEAVQATRLTATVGSVPAMGPGGVGRADRVKLTPRGYDHNYGVWRVDAADNALKVQMQVDRGELRSPILAVSAYDASELPMVRVDGVAMIEGIDYFASLEPPVSRAWITFRRGWSGRHDIEIAAPPR